MAEKAFTATGDIAATEQLSCELTTCPELDSGNTFEKRQSMSNPWRITSLLTKLP
jgi:hypothetical protein